MGYLLIRLAGLDDLDQIIRLLHQLWPGKPMDPSRLRTIFEHMTSDNHYVLLCAEKEGALAGFASLSILQNIWQEGFILYITTVIVDEQRRRQGIGTSLIREIQKIARERACKRIELESAFHRTDAHAFYEKMGFEKRAHYYSREVE